MDPLIPTPPGEMDLGLRERKNRRTRRALINGAIALFIARGFDAVTLADITAACEVSRGTVFNYFPHKEAIVLEFMDAYMQDRLGAIQKGLARGEGPIDLLWRALSIPRATAARWPIFLSIMARELLHYEQERADAAQRRLPYLPLVAEIVAAGQEAGVIGGEESAESLALYLTEATLVTVARNCGRLSKAGLDELIASRQQALLHGIIA